MIDNIKVGIIGSDGFLGSNLKTQFDKKNFTYLAADINPTDSRTIKLDVASYKTFNNLDKVDVLINLAAEHRDDVKPVSKYDEVNVNGAKNICSFCTDKNINKIIFTSSVAIYGFAPPNTDENGEPNFFNDYGRTKLLAEKVYKEWYEKDPKNRSLIIIRPTVIFGKGNRGNVYNLLKQISDNRFIMFGDGNNIKSLAYVENVAKFIRHCCNNENGLKIYNYIDKPDISVKTLVTIAREEIFNKSNTGIRLPAFIGISIGYIFDIISFIFRKNLPISSIRVKKFLMTTQFNTSITKDKTVNNVALEDALRDTIRNEFKSSISKLNKTP